MSGSQSTDALVEELLDFCRSESLSEDGLREILQRFGCAPNNNLHVSPTLFGFLFCACQNELVTEGILRYLLEHFPSVTIATDIVGMTPLHNLCNNKSVTLGIVQLLIDAHPESIDRANNNDWAPLHYLSGNKKLDDSTAVDILGLFLERCPEAARHAGEDGRLPIHIAAGQGAKSFEFCRMLIEAYPGSERIIAIGQLPLHIACRHGSVAVAEYLLKLYPESINVADERGSYPIHKAIIRVKSETPTIAIDMVQMLLDCDPNLASQKWRAGEAIEYNPLSFVVVVCFPAILLHVSSDTSKMSTAVKIIHLLYDAHPEAIFEYSNSIAAYFLFRSPAGEMKAFINTQLAYARQARGYTVRQTKTRDKNGQVPLHRALRDNATLGTLKLIVKRNPSALLIPDNSGALPLHLACQYYDSPNVVDYLIGLDPNTLTAVDRMGNTALHLACRGAKHDTIALLLEKYGAVSVSQSNALNKLPIHLLFESNSVNRADDTKYLEIVFQLLRANPETVMLPEDAKQASIPQVGRPSRNGKKRKYCT